MLYKKLGETPNERILRYKKDNPEFEQVPMTYAGRLDPMAEGLLLVLSGSEIEKKDDYLSLPKTYEFEMLWGMESDTLDVLGLTENSSEAYLSKSTHNLGAPNLLTLGSTASESLFSRNASTNFLNSTVPSVENVKEVLEKSKGKFEQKYPAYSSKPVNGKPLFAWAREGKINEIEVPRHVVEILDAEFLSRRSISGSEILENVKEKIKLVTGDFRQEEIIKGWGSILNENKEKEYTIDTISITVSSGFYVRQFVADLAESFCAKALTFHIARKRIGDYLDKDSV